MGSTNMEMSDDTSVGDISFNQAIDTSRTQDSPCTEDDMKLQGKSRQVFRLKIVVLIALVIAAVFAGVAAYILSNNQQQQRFEVSFRGDAEKLVHSFSRATENIYWAGLSLSITITSFAMTSNSQWPNVTLPDFSLQSRGALSLAHATGIRFGPVIYNETRIAFEQYAVKSQHLLDSFGTARLWPIESGIFQFSENKTMPISSPSADIYLPIWQSSGRGKSKYSEQNLVMANALSDPTLAQSFSNMRRKIGPEDSEIEIIKDLSGDISPRSTISFPVLSNTTGDDQISLVAIVAIISDFTDFFANALEKDSIVIIVTTSTCGSVLSFEVAGSNVTFLGEGDQHDDNFDDLVVMLTAQKLRLQLAGVLSEWKNYTGDSASTPDNTDSDGKVCSTHISIYPTSRYESQFKTQATLVFPLVCGALFIVNLALFLGYDVLVKRRQIIVEKTAENSYAIVNSLFPAVVRDRLIQSQHHQRMETPKDLAINPHGILTMAGARRILAAPPSEQTSLMEQFDLPIAELFQDTTVMFADIAGFTAWSSEREPAQVFQLLETLYRNFDIYAKRLGVFKVETIGDCYVCVTGLPLPSKDHAVVMARFAHECRFQMKELTKELEIVLGPGTSDLALRVGMHSGSVIAGVLRGEKSRFQLFGDTMNVASRMESNGTRDLIQVSQETADLIIAAKKEHWLTPRDDVIYAKGKGALQTYWLRPCRRPSRQEVDSSPSEDVSVATMPLNFHIKGNDEERHNANQWMNTSTSILCSDERTTRSMDNRLIDWNADILLSFLTKLVLSRDFQCVKKSKRRTQAGLAGDSNYVGLFSRPKSELRLGKISGVSVEAQRQLRLYVGKIACLYRANPFHNFEHASHVALSAKKLLKRIIAPDHKTVSDDDTCSEGLSQSTYGISSDPMLQFVIVLSALVHDVDHSGVPNAQLMKEKPEFAELYNNKSVAESHSVELALSILKDPRFRDLQNCIYPTISDFTRFKELLINAVLATDIVDKDLKVNRQKRWTEAFHGDNQAAATPVVDAVKATVVVEHIIQASDVAHTMQHWHVFCKWNELLYIEMLEAYRSGRSETDPSDGWYESEIGFFDFYIIPLAKKLEECRVFGVSSGEYLNYALQNRMEWELKGREVTKEMVAKWKNGRRSSVSMLQQIV